jgi:hypothetical protein
VNPLLTSPVLQLQLDQMMLRDSATAGMTPAQREVLLKRQRMNRNLTLYSMVQNRGARLRQAEAVQSSSRGKREIQGPVSTPTERVTRYYGRIVPSGTGRAATGYYEQPNRYFPQTGYSR